MYKVVKENPIWAQIKTRISRKNNCRHFQKLWNYKRSLRICLCHVHFPPRHPPWFQSTGSRAEGRSLAFFQAYEIKHTCKISLNLNLQQVFKHNGKTWTHFWKGKLDLQYCGFRITYNEKSFAEFWKKHWLWLFHWTEMRYWVYFKTNCMKTKLQIVPNNV